MTKNHYQTLDLYQFFQVFQKILEKLMYKRAVKFLAKYNILNEISTGFRKKRSTNLATMELITKISKVIDDKECAIGVFLDLSKVFDTVNHNILYISINLSTLV